MSKRRFTIETLAAGQARPYADTVHRYRLVFEWQGMEGYKNKDAPFIPHAVDNEDFARSYCKLFGGWTEDAEGDWASTRLEYIKQIEPHIWEWQTRAAYDD